MEGFGGEGAARCVGSEGSRPEHGLLVAGANTVLCFEAGEGVVWPGVTWETGKGDQHTHMPPALGVWCCKARGLGTVSSLQGPIGLRQVMSAVRLGATSLDSNPGSTSFLLAGLAGCEIDAGAAEMLANFSAEDGELRRDHVGSCPTQAPRRGYCRCLKNYQYGWFQMFLM